MALPLLTISLLLCLDNLAMAAYNVLSYGAKPDGQTDSASAFLDTWRRACGDYEPTTMVVPKGKFLVSKALFRGPCNNPDIRLVMKGSIIRELGYSVAPQWITFKNVEGLSIFGGTFDARGQSLWDCKTAGLTCPNGSTALTISCSKNVTISKVKVRNSEKFQMTIMYSDVVRVDKATITAPINSPNTDGIHVHMTSGVTIVNSIIGTGDDCISLGPGTTNIWIENIRCRPGHGISIGSLGRSADESIVQNVTVKSVIFRGTQNGLRIKTWANPYNGFVSNITFQHAIMKKVNNPIIIDQNYCPRELDCPNQSSGVKISGVVFDDVKGSSATTVAVKLNCSKSNPCSGIELRNIRLKYSGSEENIAESYCKNVEGNNTGFVIPPNCIADLN